MAIATLYSVVGMGGGDAEGAREERGGGRGEECWGNVVYCPNCALPHSINTNTGFAESVVTNCCCDHEPSGLGIISGY